MKSTATRLLLTTQCYKLVYISLLSVVTPHVFNRLLHTYYTLLQITPTTPKLHLKYYGSVKYLTVVCSNQGVYVYLKKSTI